MFIAIDNQGVIQMAGEYLNDRPCYCPACKEEVVFKRGSMKQPHFSHRSSSHCQSFSEGETPEHLEGKHLVYAWLKKEKIDAELEAFLPQLKQRPDVLVRYQDEQIAIEFQCSPISKETVIKRTEGYLSMGIRVFWLLGSNLKVLNTFKTQHYAYLTMNPKGQCFLFHLDVKERVLEKIALRGKNTQGILFDRQRLPFSSSFDTVMTAFNQVARGLKPGQENRKTQERKLYQMSYYKSDNSRCLFSLMYQKQISLDLLPDSLFYRVPAEWPIKTLSYYWKLLVYLWVHELKMVQVITEKSIARRIEQWTASRDIVFYDCPNVDTPILYQPVIDYLDILCKQNILKKVGEKKWKRVK